MKTPPMVDESQIEQREDAGRGRDVAEGGGERTEEAERSVKLLLVAESSKVLAVCRLARGSPLIHLPIEPTPGDPCIRMIAATTCR